MPDFTVKVKGLRELDRAFKSMSADLRKELRHELGEAGRIVSDEARRLFAPYDARSAMGIRHRLKGGTEVFVEQRKGKTTGQHPEFGDFQMRKALLPARARKRAEVVDRIDRMLARLGGEHGF
jgi:hypothetical protein